MKFSEFHPNVRLRIIMNFFTNSLSNMFMPFMAVYFAKSLGTTAAGVSTVLSIVIGLVFAALGGHYADRVGRKKMMILSEAVCVVCYVIMALINSPWLHSASVTLAMTMLVNAGWGLSRPVVDAMLIDVTTPETRKSMYRITYWSNNLSISVAGMIGAYFFSDYIFELFIAVAAMSLLSLLVTLLYIEETLPAVASEVRDMGKKRSILGSYKQVFRDMKFMAYFLATVLTVSVERNLTNYIGIRLEDHMHHVSWFPRMTAYVNGLQMLGYLRTENTIAVVVLSLFVGRLMAGRSDLKTMLVALALNIIGYTYLVYGNQPLLLIVLMLVATVGELVYVPIKQALLTNLVPDHSRSSYMAVNGMAMRSSQIVAGVNVVIGGFLSTGGDGCRYLFDQYGRLADLYDHCAKPGDRKSEAAAGPGTIRAGRLRSRKVVGWRIRRANGHPKRETYAEKPHNSGQWEPQAKELCGKTA